MNLMIVKGDKMLKNRERFLWSDILKVNFNVYEFISIDRARFYLLVIIKMYLFYDDWHVRLNIIIIDGKRVVSGTIVIWTLKYPKLDGNFVDVMKFSSNSACFYE